MHWKLRYTNFRLIPSFSMFFFKKNAGPDVKISVEFTTCIWVSRKEKYHTWKKGLRTSNLSATYCLLVLTVFFFIWNVSMYQEKKRELLQAPFSQSFTSRTWSMNSHQGTKRLKDRNTPLNTACRTENIVKPQHFFQETLFEYSTYFKQHRIYYQIT